MVLVLVKGVKMSPIEQDPDSLERSALLDKLQLGLEPISSADGESGHLL
jgi:hypothetical protein